MGRSDFRQWPLSATLKVRTDIGTRNGADFIRNLSRQYDLSPSFESGFGTAQNRLHNHFYTGLLTSQQFAESMEHGIAFVQQMLDIAQQNRNPG